MKKFVKRLFIGFGVLFALIVVIGLLADGGTTGEETKATGEVKTVERSPEKKVEVVAEQPKNSPYDRILVGDGNTGEGGMTYEEILAIVGRDPDMHTTSEIDVLGEVIKSDMYVWSDGKGGGFSVILTNGHVSTKVEVGK